MPERRIRVHYAGREVEATPVGFTTSAEHWNEYLLSDRTLLRMKTVVTKVLRVEGEFDPEGNPVYLTTSTNIVVADAPEELRRR